MEPGSISPGAVGVQHLAPFHHVALAAVFLDELVDVIAALAVALGALDAENVELVFDVAEDEIRAGHGGQTKSPTPNYRRRALLERGGY
jgi:hypothetical protein